MLWMLNELLNFSNRRASTPYVLLLQGALQEVHLISGPHGYLTQCPHLSSTCPTCGQFSLLQNTVEQLTKHLHELSERVGKFSVFFCCILTVWRRDYSCTGPELPLDPFVRQYSHSIIFYIEFNYVCCWIEIHIHFFALIFYISFNN